MARKKGGLGRGLAALIPDDQQDEVAKPSSPMDVIFGEGRGESAASGLRGGSARDLLMPSQSKRRASGKGAGRTVKGSYAASERDAQAAGGAAGALRGKDAADAAGSTGAVSDAEKDVTLVPLEGTTFGEIPLDSIVPNRWQPREVFDEEMLDELAESIRQVGVLQPVVVRRLSDGDVSRETSPSYEIIMGERRWRAAERAGLGTIPALIRQTEDADMLREALLENLHRSQLNPLEEAAAYQQLMEDFNCTQAQLSERIARSRPQIANTLRLLKLPGAVQRRVAAEVISAGHARALLGLTDPQEMEYLADRIVAEGLSVRSTEEIVALGDVHGAVSSKGGARRTPTPRKSAADPRYQGIVDRLTDRLETRVKVMGGKAKGRLVIEFSGDEDLARIEEIISGNVR